MLQYCPYFDKKKEGSPWNLLKKYYLKFIYLNKVMEIFYFPWRPRVSSSLERTFSTSLEGVLCWSSSLDSTESISLLWNPRELSSLGSTDVIKSRDSAVRTVFLFLRRCTAVLAGVSADWSSDKSADAKWLPQDTSCGWIADKLIWLLELDSDTLMLWTISSRFHRFCSFKLFL